MKGDLSIKKKNYKKYLAGMLACVMVVSTSTTAFAENNSTYVNVDNATDVAGNVIITDDGVTINGIYYTKTEFESLLNKAVKVETAQTRAAIAAGIYFIPGIGEIAIAATGAIVVAGVAVAAGSQLYDTITNWLSDSTAKEIAEVRAKIPSRLRDENGDVDLGQFDQKVNGKTAYKEKGGWMIDKDNAGHGGRTWKLKDKSGNRVASLGENGEVLGKQEFKLCMN